MKILILSDYKGAFYSSTKNIRTLCTLDIEKLKKYFELNGFETYTSSFSKIDFSKGYKGYCIIYTSSEDRGLKYKSYIEDIICFLKEQGAIIIPDYNFLRAHHNKSFMEILRYKMLPEQAKILNTRIFGTLEELKAADLPDQQYIIKSAFGAGSKYVKYAKNKVELLKIAAKISRSMDLEDILSEYKKRFLWKFYHPSSLNRNKFIIQNFIDGLSGDFKVLRYGKKYYTLYRQNRDNDFRASGGGKLKFDIPDSVNKQELLDFAKNMSEKIGTPLCSLDIAWDGSQFILIEFQCLFFGPYTAEKSDYCNINENGVWKTIKEPTDIEKNICEATIDFLSECQDK